MRLRMLLAIAALVLVVAGVVAVASPYAPAAAPAPEDVEEIWAIEDAREESDVPLVTALEARLEEYTALLEGSGALVRDLERWADNTAFSDTYEFITVAAMHWPLIDEAMELLVTTAGPVDFLSQTQYEGKAGDIFPEQGDDE